MGYNHGILRRFGEDISKGRTVDGADFLAALERVEYEPGAAVGDLRRCTTMAVENALNGTGLEYLLAELAQRVHEFITPEDLDEETVVETRVRP